MVQMGTAQLACRVWLDEDRKQNDDQQNSNDCVDHVENLLSASWPCSLTRGTLRKSKGVAESCLAYSHSRRPAA